MDKVQVAMELERNTPPRSSPSGVEGAKEKKGKVKRKKQEERGPEREPEGRLGKVYDYHSVVNLVLNHPK